MMFTIEPARLLRMMERETSPTVGPDALGQSPVVCLQACRGKLALHLEGACYEANSVVWREGQCRVSAGELLEVIRYFRFEPTVTVDVKYGLMRIRHAAVPVLGFCAWTATSDNEQSDFATD